MLSPMVDQLRKIIEASVMLFDPNRESAKITRSALQRAGILELRYHLDVEAAKVYVKESNPELVIVDLSPDIQEFSVDLMRHIRSKITEKSPRILALLGTGAPDGLKTAIANGADIVVVKPLIPDTLQKKVEYLMDTPQDYIRITGYFGPDPKRLEKRNK